MKKFISTLLLVVALLFPVTINTGCGASTLPPAQQAVVTEYKTLSNVINTVEIARGIYAELWKAGKVPKELDDKVAVVYAEYQRVGNLAIEAAKLHASLATPTSGQPQYNLYIPQFQALVNQLIDLFNLTPTYPQKPHVLISPNAGV